MRILNTIFGIKPKKTIRFKYNAYHKKYNNEDMFVYQKFLSEPDLNKECPYDAKVIAIFRNIRPKKGISNINFIHSMIVLYDQKEIARYMSIHQKRIYS